MKHCAKPKLSSNHSHTKPKTPIDMNKHKNIMNEEITDTNPEYPGLTFDGERSFAYEGDE
jgi:hypothetical protein